MNWNCRDQRSYPVRAKPWDPSRPCAHRMISESHAAVWESSLKAAILQEISVLASTMGVLKVLSRSLMKMSFFSPNLSPAGRLVRAAASTLLAIGSWLIWASSWPGGILLAGAAIFVAFEALRGWCVMRACGIRTRI